MHVRSVSRQIYSVSTEIKKSAKMRRGFFISFKIYKTIDNLQRRKNTRMYVLTEYINYSRQNKEIVQSNTIQ